MQKMSNPSLERLKEQRDKMTARIQAAEARIKTSSRKKETRKKILVGAYYLDKAVKEHTLDEVKSLMDTYLKRNSDRELFGLALLEESK